MFIYFRVGVKGSKMLVSELNVKRLLAANLVCSGLDMICIEWSLCYQTTGCHSGVT